MSSFASSVVRRAFLEYAELRRRISAAGSAQPALRHVDADRSDLDEWCAATERAHDAYRAACPVPDADVAVVCVTNRPWLLDDVVANIARQEHRPAEVVVVLNGRRSAAADSPRPDVAAADRRLDVLRADVGRVSLLVRTGSASLGACLNAAMDSATSRYVAKFDDDDRYGPRYLSDALRAHGYAGAGIVGKHSWYAHLADTDETILRFPGHEFTYTSTLAGASLVIDRDRTAELRFRDVSVGEDRAFIAECNRHGITTFAADRFNLVVERGTDHSWSIPRADFVERSLPVGAGIPLDVIDR